MTTHEVPAYERPRTALMDVGELSRYLCVSRATIYRLVAKGELVPLRAGERLRFRVEDVDSYLEREPAP